MKTLLALSLILPPLAGLAADRDDRILPYGTENEHEYPHEVIRHEEEAAEHEQAYQRGVIDQLGSDDIEQTETFNPAYQKGSLHGIQP